MPKIVDQTTDLVRLFQSTANSDRDYAGEMRALMDQTAQGIGYAAPTAAQKIVDFLRMSDPELLVGWLNAQAVGMVREAINQRDHSVRSYNRVAARRSVFAKAAKDFEDTGDGTELRTKFLDEVYVVDTGAKMRLRNMTSFELSYVADGFRKQARDHLMQEAFLRALAKKCKDQSVGDVFSEETLARLWCSLTTK